MAEGNGWTPDKRYIEESLLRIERDLKAQTDHMDRRHGQIYAALGKLREEVVALKVKSGIWGLMGGLIPVVIALALYLVFKR